jgi:hypothetical protein
VHHPIDPKIDCVFKALLGSELNRALLIHFLNAILGKDLMAPITWVEILNPYNRRNGVMSKPSDKGVAVGQRNEKKLWTFCQLRCSGLRNISSAGKPALAH